MKLSLSLTVYNCYCAYWPDVDVDGCGLQFDLVFFERVQLTTHAQVLLHFEYVSYDFNKRVHVESIFGTVFELPS